MFKRIPVLAMASLAIAVGLGACTPEKKAPTAPVSESDKIMYTLGIALGTDLKRLELSEAEVDMVAVGLKDGILGKKPVVDREEYTKKLNDLAKERMTAAVARDRKAADEYVAAQAAKEGAKQSESGVVYIEHTAGTGPKATPSDSVTVHYTGSLKDGTVFDSSVDRGEPVTFPLNRVIPCWTEGLQNMQVGTKATLVCPPDTAYGDRGSPPTIPPASALSFEVELLGIKPAPEADEKAAGDKPAAKTEEKPAN